MTNVVRYGRTLGFVLALGLTAAPLTAVPVLAQGGGMFAPVVTVNGVGISRYEIDQRVRFMQLLRQPGDLRAEAEKTLIEDRLRTWKAKQDGVTVTQAQIDEGMDEFAGRANLTRQQFVAEISAGGVAEETFRDFVLSGLVWREVVRARYAGRIHVTDTEVARALLVEAERGRGTRILLSEIIIPAPPEHIGEARALAEEVSKIKGDAAFASAAEQVSAAATRERGGRLDWMPLQNLPPALRPVIMGLKPGQASAPIELGGAFGIFMLRGLDEAGAVGATPQKLGYATLALGAPGTPAGAALVANVAANAKRCDDLYTVAKDQPAANLVRVEPQSQNAIPQDIGVALAHLDIGETTVLNRGGEQVLVMLCARDRVLPEGQAAPDRETVRNNLLNQRIGTYADNYLADLMSEAVIVRP